jgi:hypothetical protein
MSTGSQLRRPRVPAAWQDLNRSGTRREAVAIFAAALNICRRAPWAWWPGFPCLRWRGILGVRGYGLTYIGDWTDLLHVYRAFSPDVPRELLWLFDWGCAIWSLVDCSRPEGQMWVWDPNGAENPSPANSLFRQAMTLADWLAAWLLSRLDLPRIADDEIPGQLTLFEDTRAGPR